MTYAEKFVRDSVTFVPDRTGNPRWAHLKLPNARKIDLDDPVRIYQPNARVKCVTNTEDKYISVELRVRFVRSLESCGDNIPRMCVILLQIFSEDAVKYYFSDIWIKWNNVAQRKRNHTIECMSNRERKLHGVDRVKKEVEFVVANRSAAKHARILRDLQR